MLVFKVATSNMVSSSFPHSGFFLKKKPAFSLKEHLPCLAAELRGKMLPSSGFPRATAGSYGGPRAERGSSNSLAEPSLTTGKQTLCYASEKSWFSSSTPVPTELHKNWPKPQIAYFKTVIRKMKVWKHLSLWMKNTSSFSSFRALSPVPQNSQFLSLTVLRSVKNVVCFHVTAESGCFP